MNNFSFSDTRSLINHLEQEGIPLDVDWQIALPYLSVRVENVFKKTGIVSFRDVLLAMDENGINLLRCENFGMKSLRDLTAELENLLQKLPGEIASQIADHTNKPPDSLFEGNSSISLLEMLEDQGIALDKNWDEILVNLPVRAKNALQNSVFISLRDVAREIDNGGGTLLELENLGRKSLQDIRQALERLASGGLNVYLYGNSGKPPADFDELTAMALELLKPDEKRLILRRVFDSATLDEVGREYGLTRERIRQKENKIIERLSERLSGAARALTDPIVNKVEEAGGIIHHQTVASISGNANLKYMLLGLMIAGRDSFRIWRDEYIANLPSQEPDLKVSELRRKLWEKPTDKMTFAEAEQIAQEVGLSDAPLISNLIVEWGGEILEGGRVRVGRWTIGDHLARILKEAEKPLHFSELTEIYIAKFPEYATKLLDDGIDGVESLESRKKSLEHSIHSCLLRAENIYFCNKGTFIHASYLPVPQDELDEIVEWCVKRLEGETGLVSTSYLLRELASADFDTTPLNKYILKNILARQPDIVSPRKFFVGHAASFQEHGVTQRDRIESILRSAEKPLTAEDVIKRLPLGVEYFPNSIALLLLRSQFAVKLSGGMFCHIDSLGLSQGEHAEICNFVHDLLPADGSPSACRMLLRHLRDEIIAAKIINREDAEVVLWGLLRLDSRIECGFGNFVARKSLGSSSLLQEAVLQAVKDLRVAYARDIRREIINIHGYRGSDSYVSHCIQKCVERGLLRHLPGLLYCLASLDEEGVLQALEMHSGKMQRIFDKWNLSELPSDDLLLLARYFYRRNQLPEAHRLLELLALRSDLLEEQRRSVNRLQRVIWSRLEEN